MPEPLQVRLAGYAPATSTHGEALDAREVLDRAVATAVKQQRDAAARKEVELRAWLAGRGTRIIELDDDRRAAFRAVAGSVLEEVRNEFDDELWSLLGGRD